MQNLRLIHEAIVDISCEKFCSQTDGWVNQVLRTWTHYRLYHANREWSQSQPPSFHCLVKIHEHSCVVKYHAHGGTSQKKKVLHHCTLGPQARELWLLWGKVDWLSPPKQIWFRYHGILIPDDSLPHSHNKHHCLMNIFHTNIDSVNTRNWYVWWHLSES